MTTSGQHDAPAGTDGELAVLLAAIAEMLDHEPDTVWTDDAVRAAAKRLRDDLSGRIGPA